MIEQAFADVAMFHRRFGLEYNGEPRMLPGDIGDFRLKFMNEEADEFVRSPSRELQLDALVDLVYVALGTLHLHCGAKLPAGIHWPEPYDVVMPVKPIADVTGANRQCMALIDAYEHATAVIDKLLFLVSLAHVCETLAVMCGWDFSEAWRRVHVANMKKIRAPNADQSTRGSTYDVIKPVGWRPAPLWDLC